MKVFLTGFMGSGKSTYGKKLSKQLGYEHIDLDALIEEQSSKSISDWFANDGEEEFRAKEAETLRSLVEFDDVVISTGGGAACFHNNIQWMNENGFTAYLKLLEPQLLKRLKKGKEERPLIADLSEKEIALFIHEMLNERSMFYSQSKIVIQPEQFQPKHLADYIKAL
ncbi:MAG: shikimate kinase [Bacteroidia bacterium]